MKVSSLQYVVVFQKREATFTDQDEAYACAWGLREQLAPTDGMRHMSVPGISVTVPEVEIFVRAIFEDEK